MLFFSICMTSLYCIKDFRPICHLYALPFKLYLEYPHLNYCMYNTILGLWSYCWYVLLYTVCINPVDICPDTNNTELNVHVIRWAKNVCLWKTKRNKHFTFIPWWTIRAHLPTPVMHTRLLHSFPCSFPPSISRVLNGIDRILIYGCTQSNFLHVLIHEAWNR